MLGLKNIILLRVVTFAAGGPRVLSDQQEPLPVDEGKDVAVRPFQRLGRGTPGCPSRARREILADRL